MRFVKQCICTLFKMSLNYDPECLAHDKSLLVQVMACVYAIKPHLIKCCRHLHHLREPDNHTRSHISDVILISSNLC